MSIPQPLLQNPPPQQPTLSQQQQLSQWAQWMAVQQAAMTGAKAQSPKEDEFVTFAKKVISQRYRKPLRLSGIIGMITGSGLWVLSALYLIWGARLEQPIPPYSMQLILTSVLIVGVGKVIRYAAEKDSLWVKPHWLE